MTTLSKDEVLRLESEAAKHATGRDDLAHRFATLCRADLVAENERLTKDRNEWRESTELANVRFKRAEAENAALKADAERYQWLTSLPNGGLFHSAFAISTLASWKTKAQHDAAIDDMKRGEA